MSSKGKRGLILSLILLALLLPVLSSNVKTVKANPDIAYLYNSCETYNHWTLPTNPNNSLYWGVTGSFGREGRVGTQNKSMYLGKTPVYAYEGDEPNGTYGSWQMFPLKSNNGTAWNSTWTSQADRVWGAWIYWTNKFHWGNYGSIYTIRWSVDDLGVDDSWRYMNIVEDPENENSWAIYFDGEDGGVPWIYIGTGYTLSNNTWYWVEFKQESNYVRFYVDGDLQGSRSGVTPKNLTRFMAIVTTSTYKDHSVGYPWDGFYVDYLRCANETQYPPTNPDPDFGNVDLSISNMEGCGNWVFAEEKYYDFNVTVFSSNISLLDVSQVNFADSGGHNITAGWDYSLNKTILINGGADDPLEYVVRAKTGTFNYNVSQIPSGNYATVFIQIYFTENIIDSFNVDLYIRTNLTDGSDTGWEQYADYFNIYSAGGWSNLTGSNSGRYAGGQTFDLWSGNFDTNETSWARQELYFRYLQSVHGLWMFNAYDGGGATNNGAYQNLGLNGYWEFGMDYCPDTTDNWTEGWKAQIRIYSWEQSGSGTNNQTWEIRWMMKMGYSTWLTVRTDYIGSFFEQTNIADDSGIRLFVDLWFGMENASGFGEGRVSPYYKAWENSWLPWVGGNPIQMNYVSTFAQQLTDDQNTTITYENIKMCRFWTYMYVDMYYQPSYDDDTYKERYEIDHVEGLNYHISRSIEGTDEPVWVEPKDPEVYSWGLLEPLRKALLAIGSTIVNGLIVAFSILGKAMIGGLDAILDAIFHQPYLFTNFLVSVGEVLGSFSTFFGWIITFFSGAISFVANVLTVVSLFIFSIFTFIGNIAGMITGGMSATITIAGDFWNGTGIFTDMGFSFKTIFEVVIVGFFIQLMIGWLTFGEGWLWGWIEKGIMILGFIKDILIWGFEMISGIISMLVNIFKPT